MNDPRTGAIDPARSGLAAKLTSVLGKIFGNLGQAEAALAEKDVYGMLERPPELKLGDYAFPCFRFAKSLRRKPNDIAKMIADEMKASQADADWWQQVDVAGAFCNFTVKPGKVAQLMIEQAVSGKFKTVLAEDQQRANTNVMIEYSQPNTHKEFHVGHGRNICLGDSMVRLFRYCGYQVIAANYPGDEGAHIAKCLWYIRKYKQEIPSSDQGPWLGQMYTQADAAMRAAENPDECKKEISQVLSAIEAKTGEMYELWQKTREWSLDDFRRIYRLMDVHFDQYFYESELSSDSQKIVDEFLAQGVFKLDDGAVGIDLSDDKLGFMLVRKRDGNTLYATKDLVLARRKFKDFKIDRSIYVVGAEQQLHFKQVFKTLEKMGFAAAKNCYHLSYGLVTLPEGKMSSRSGNSVSFQSLVDGIQEELQAILARYESEPDWTKEEIDETARRLCVGAIKYGMLNADPNKNIVFNLKEWLAFEGSSGPYLMYSYARMRSILRKADYHATDLSSVDFEIFQTLEERDLLRYLHDFNLVVMQATEQYRPNHLLHHLYESARAFNRFYANVAVMKAESDVLRQGRLALISAYAAMLHQGLSLLGITPPERM